MKTGAIIPLEILMRTDLPMYVKLAYGRVFVLIERSGAAVLTTDELAGQCGMTRREAAKSLRHLVSLGLIRFHRSLDDKSCIHVLQCKQAPWGGREMSAVMDELKE